MAWLKWLTVDIYSAAAAAGGSDKQYFVRDDKVPVQANVDSLTCTTQHHQRNQKGLFVFVLYHVMLLEGYWMWQILEWLQYSNQLPTWKHFRLCVEKLTKKWEIVLISTKNQWAKLVRTWNERCEQRLPTQTTLTLWYGDEMPWMMCSLNDR
jgi:hypothetical protein